MQGDVLAPPDAHSKLQALEPIESAHALPIHQPPLSAQQDPDSEIAEARPWATSCCERSTLRPTPLFGVLGTGLRTLDSCPNERRTSA